MTSDRNLALEITSFSNRSIAILAIPQKSVAEGKCRLVYRVSRLFFNAQSVDRFKEIERIRPYTSFDSLINKGWKVPFPVQSTAICFQEVPSALSGLNEVR
jgi:hypothetical protein